MKVSENKEITTACSADFISYCSYARPWSLGHPLGLEVFLELRQLFEMHLTECTWFWHPPCVGTSKSFDSRRALFAQTWLIFCFVLQETIENRSARPQTADMT